MAVIEEVDRGLTDIGPGRPRSPSTPWTLCRRTTRAWRPTAVREAKSDSRRTRAGASMVPEARSTSNHYGASPCKINNARSGRRCWPVRCVKRVILPRPGAGLSTVWQPPPPGQRCWHPRPGFIYMGADRTPPGGRPWAWPPAGARLPWRRGGLGRDGAEDASKTPNHGKRFSGLGEPDAGSTLLLLARAARPHPGSRRWCADFATDSSDWRPASRIQRRDPLGLPDAVTSACGRRIER